MFLSCVLQIGGGGGGGEDREGGEEDDDDTAAPPPPLALGQRRLVLLTDQRLGQSIRRCIALGHGRPAKESKDDSKE